MKIEEGKRVRLKVMLKVVDGDVLEKNVVEYFQGGGSMLPGLEKLLDGCEPGAVKSGVLPAEKAFGDPAMQAKKTISRSEFPDDAKFEVGMTFEAKGADGAQTVVLQVAEVRDDEIECNLCHPLFDKDIKYEVEVLAVTDPTPPPLPPGAVDDLVEESSD